MSYPHVSRAARVAPQAYRLPPRLLQFCIFASRERNGTERIGQRRRRRTDGRKDGAQKGGGERTKPQKRKGRKGLRTRRQAEAGDDGATACGCWSTPRRPGPGYQHTCSGAHGPHARPSLPLQPPLPHHRIAPIHFSGSGSTVKNRSTTGVRRPSGMQILSTPDPHISVFTTVLTVLK
jgi:hypothetical protein